MDSVLEVLAGSCLRGVAFLEEVLAVVLEGCDIFVAVFWRGVAFFCLQCFGGVWHFWRVLWRGVAFLEGTCYVLKGCLQCF